LEQKIEPFTKQLNRYLLNSTSYYDLIKEQDYHNLMGGILAPLVRKYIIESNKESGYGRYDHLLIPRIDKSNNNAFIIEYKVCQSENELEQSTIVGLKQINQQHYDTQIKQYPQVKQITKIALSFYGKKVMSKYETQSI